MLKKIILPAVISLAFFSTAVFADGVNPTHPILKMHINQCKGILKHINCPPIIHHGNSCLPQKLRDKVIADCVSYMGQHIIASPQQLTAFFQQELAEQNVILNSAQVQQAVEKSFAETETQGTH